MSFCNFDERAETFGARSTQWKSPRMICAFKTPVHARLRERIVRNRGSWRRVTLASARIFVTIHA
jgi:hypothetical protein